MPTSSPSSYSCTSRELRTEIEDRRGVLLMREIENRIKESGVETADDEES